MKKGWETLRLEEVCKEITDGSHFSPKTTDVGYPYVTVRDIENDQIDFANCKFISTVDYNQLLKNGCKPHRGNVLFSKDGTVGKVAMIDYDKDFVVLSSLAIVRPDSERINSTFLKYVMKSPAFLNDAVGKKTGVAIRRIILRNLKSIPIHVPSLPEQKRIVAILDEAFDAVDKAKVNAEKNLANARELFESYLQSVFENKGEGWEEKNLGDVCAEIFAGGDAPKDNFSKEKNEKFKVPIFANAVKDNGLYGFTNSARVTEPSITIAARGSGTGHTELRNESFLPIVRLIVIIPNLLLITLEFLKYSIDSLEIMRSGSAIPQLTVPMIKEYKVSLPTLDEQKQIVQILNTLSAETKKLEAIYKQKIVDLEELKKAILQSVFDGKL